MKELIRQILILFFLIILCNVFIEFITEGSLDSLLRRIDRFLIITTFVSVIAGYLNYRVMKTMPKE
jgi:hypothetical protein